MSSASGYYQNRYPVPPFSSSDPRVVMDYGVGSNTPWSNDGSTLNAQYGFAKVGTGTLQFDPALGINCGASADIRSSTPLPNAPVSEGTIYLEVERAGFAESNVNGSLFFDNQNSRVVGTGGSVLRFGTYGQNYLELKCNQTGAGTQTINSTVHFNSSTQAGFNCVAHLNSNAPFQLDSRFASLIFTWRGGTFYTYLDGQFVPGGTPFASGPTSALFNSMCLGSSTGTANTYWQYWIRRIQVTTQFTQIPLAGPLIGILGDSFVARGTSNASPAGDPTPTAAAVSAVNYFGNLTTRSQSNNTGYAQTFGQSCWFMHLSGIIAKQLGFLPRVFVAGAAGHGWASDVAPFGQGYGDALIQAQPERLICIGSVNDINTGAPPANLGADTLAKLNYITAGKTGGTNWANGVTQYPRRLRQILFFETFTWEYASSPFNPAFQAIRKSNWASQYAALNGAVSNGVPITPIAVCDVGTPGIDAWNTDPAIATFTGGNLNPNNTSGSVDAHPCATGMVRMAQIMAPYWISAMNGSPY